MTISVLTRREQVRTVFDRFRRSYSHYKPDAPLPWIKDGRTRDQVFDQLSDLDVEGCTYEAVDKIIGNDSWVSLRCDECDEQNEALVRIGGEPDCEERWVDMCQPCLAKALASIPVK